MGKDCEEGKTCNFDYSPVCGSNGITYDNECFLRKLSCKEDSKIEIVGQGMCESSSDGEEEECPKLCTADYKPICGSDGKTYNNKCNLRAYLCAKDHLEVTIRHEGECDQDYDYDQKESREDDSENDDDDDSVENDVNSAKSLEDDPCWENCDRMMDPVCVNKNRQFSNKCNMDVVVCQEHIQVRTTRTVGTFLNQPIICIS